MIYRDFKDKKISMLGMGTMRFPLVDGSDSQIDERATGEMFDLAIENGVNYFDTAWGYHSGNSEPVVGKLLKKYPRESWFLATKFPGYDLKNIDKVEEIFEKQLERCGVDYFDFYLFHNVCEMNVNEYLDEKYGILEYLLKQKENGRIKHLGFSAHGNMQTMTKFLEAYGKHMEFCQLQINWLDWFFQGAKAKVELVKKYNIPVWIMEPVRGGKLAKLDEAFEKSLKELRPDESIPAWAFRFCQGVNNTTVILSGMSNMEQIKDNLKTFEKEKPLSDRELGTLYEIAGKMLDKKILPCTACRYCTDHCPKELDIPTLIDLYNEHSFSEGGFIAPMALEAMDKDKYPTACIGCKSCEAVCPQNIEIAKAMKGFAEMI